MKSPGEGRGVKKAKPKETYTSGPISCLQVWADLSCVHVHVCTVDLFFSGLLFENPLSPHPEVATLCTQRPFQRHKKMLILRTRGQTQMDVAGDL